MAISKGLRRNTFAAPSLFVAAALSICLAVSLPGHAFAQGSDETASPRRFAVGGGALLNTVVCIECSEPSVAGFSGGFEVRITRDWSLIAEGLWTDGYEVRSITRDGITYPALTHDYFVFANVKFRWQFSRLRHRPYMVLGGAARWHRDTNYRYGVRSDSFRQFLDFDDVQVIAEKDTAGAAILGFGWSFRLGDRFEIRPEADLYLGRIGYANVGITGWFGF